MKHCDAVLARCESEAEVWRCPLACVCQGGQVAVTVPRQVAELPVTHPQRGWESPGNVVQVWHLVSPLFDCGLTTRNVCVTVFHDFSPR